MTAPNKIDEPREAAVMAMVLRTFEFLQAGPTPFGKTGDHLSATARYYTEMFLACGKLCHLREPAALVQNCIVMARKGAEFHGDTYRGQELKSLAELFERHPEESAAYAREWDAAITRQNGGA